MCSISMSYQNEKIRFFSISHFISFYDKNKIMKIKKKYWEQVSIVDLYFKRKWIEWTIHGPFTKTRKIKNTQIRTRSEQEKALQLSCLLCSQKFLLLCNSIVVHGLWKNLPAFDLFLVTKYIEIRVQGFHTPRNRWKHEAAGRLFLLFRGIWSPLWNEAIQIYSVLHIWHFPFKMLPYA